MSVFPTTVALADMTITSLEPTQVSTTHSLKRQVRSRGGQRWAIRGNYAPLDRTQAAELYAFGVAQRGQFGTFTIVPPAISTPLGSANGTPLVTGNHSAGETAIDVDGWTANQSSALKPGDYIKFTHDKVYLVTNTVASNYAGVSIVNIHPALTTALANNDAVTVHNVPFTVAFASDQRDLSAVAAGTFGYEISLVEVV